MFQIQGLSCKSFRNMLLGLALCTGVCVACVSKTVVTPLLEISPLQDLGSEFEVSVASGQTLIDISSAKGIGGASVELVQGRWPEAMHVRLHLEGLEGFSVSSIQAKFDLSELHVKAIDASGNDFTGKYLMENGGFYDVLLPQALFDGNTNRIEMHWVDFYR